MKALSLSPLGDRLVLFVWRKNLPGYVNIVDIPSGKILAEVANADLVGVSAECDTAILGTGDGTSTDRLRGIDVRSGTDRYQTAVKAWFRVAAGDKFFSTVGGNWLAVTEHYEPEFQKLLNWVNGPIAGHSHCERRKAQRRGSTKQTPGGCGVALPSSACCRRHSYRLTGGCSRLRQRFNHRAIRLAADKPLIWFGVAAGILALPIVVLRTMACPTIGAVCRHVVELISTRGCHARCFERACLQRPCPRKAVGMAPIHVLRPVRRSSS